MLYQIARWRMGAVRSARPSEKGERAVSVPPFRPDTAVDRVGGVPPIIFQTWKSRRSLPSNYFVWSRSLQDRNPGSRYVLWDDDDNRSFITREFPWFLPTYESYPREIFRADAVRYFFLYMAGGFYADLDTEALRPVAPLLDEGDVILGRMGMDSRFEHSIPNAIMASKPGAEFWLLVIEMMLEAHARSGGFRGAEGVEAATGPVLLKRAVDLYGERPDEAASRIARVVDRLRPEQLPRPGRSHVRLLAPEVWYPIDWNNPLHQRLRKELLAREILLDERTKQALFPASTLVTYWSHSW